MTDTYRVTDQYHDTVERTDTGNIDEACIIACVMSRSNEDRNSNLYFVEDKFNNIIYIFVDGIRFSKPRE